MHAYEIPAAVKERVVNRMGKLTVNETVDASRCAFIVIDMQNYFCAEGFPAEVPMARRIVPNINRVAEAVRSSSGRTIRSICGRRIGNAAAPVGRPHAMLPLAHRV